MFVDLVGSTALSTRLDPEDMREVIRAYQDAVAGEVARFEGHVAKFMGDGVLAYFGWPRAHEDDAERAVRAGLDDRRGGRPAAPRRTASRWPPGSGSRPGWWWWATWSAAAPRARRRSSARRRTWPRGCRGWPSRAAWSSPTARAGSSATCSSCADLGAVDAQGLRRAGPGLPGRSASGAAEGRFEALHAAAAAAAGRARGGAGPAAATAGEQAKGGEGQVVLLSGEPGIGKSRLLRGAAGAARATSRTPACATPARRTTRTARCTRDRGPARARGRVRARRSAGGAAREAGGAAGADLGARGETWRPLAELLVAPGRRRATPRRRSPRSADGSGPSRRSWPARRARPAERPC